MAPPRQLHKPPYAGRCEVVAVVFIDNQPPLEGCSLSEQILD
jgi:hypothetical protein